MRVNGRRGAFLILFGVLYVARGLAYCTAGPDDPVRRYMAWMPDWSPLWLCGLAWTVAGMVAVASAFAPMPEDRFGFVALSACATGWTVAYAVAWATGYSGWNAALTFALLAVAIYVVSGMPNPISKRRLPGG